MTPEEEAQLSALQKKKWNEGAAERERIAAENRQGHADKKAYETAYWEAHRANQIAHANYGPLGSLPTKHVNFDPNAQNWGSDALDSNKTYLCVTTGASDESVRFFFGRAGYYKAQKRWTISGNFCSHQAEHLLQIHEIELPKITARLVEFPIKTAAMLKLEEKDEDDE